MADSLSVNRASQEHLLYIHEKVNPLLEPLVTAVLLERPEDPAFFMLKWLTDQSKNMEGPSAPLRGDGSAGAAAIAAQIEELQERRARLLALKSTRGLGNAASSPLGGLGPGEEAAHAQSRSGAVGELRELSGAVPCGAVGAGQLPDAEMWRGPAVEQCGADVEGKEHGQDAGDGNNLAKGLCGEAEENDDDDEDEDEDEDEEDEGDEEVGDAPVAPPPGYLAPRRLSVSAECSGPPELSEEFVPTVYDKTLEVSARIRTCVRASFLFSSLEESEIETLVSAFKERNGETGERIIEQGDCGDSMYLLESGRVECLKRRDGSSEEVVKSCEPGDVFGELALLYNCPRAASVICRERSALWELDRATFARVVQVGAARKRARYSDFLQKMPIFSNLSQYDLMTISDALVLESFEEAGTEVIRQGDVGDRFFLVWSGECVATRISVDDTLAGPGPQVLTHRAGDYFGELALLKDAPRAAGVRTSVPNVQLLSMDRRTFKRLCGPLEGILSLEAGRYAAAATQPAR